MEPDDHRRILHGKREVVMAGRDSLYVTTVPFLYDWTGRYIPTRPILSAGREGEFQQESCFRRHRRGRDGGNILMTVLPSRLVPSRPAVRVRHNTLISLGNFHGYRFVWHAKVATHHIYNTPLCIRARRPKNNVVSTGIVERYIVHRVWAFFTELNHFWKCILIAYHPDYQTYEQAVRPRRSPDTHALLTGPERGI